MYGILYTFKDGTWGSITSSVGSSECWNYSIRPIVTLKSSAELELSKQGENSISNPHKIVNY